MIKKYIEQIVNERIKEISEPYRWENRVLLNRTIKLEKKMERIDKLLAPPSTNFDNSDNHKENENDILLEIVEILEEKVEILENKNDSDMPKNRGGVATFIGENNSMGLKKYMTYHYTLEKSKYQEWDIIMFVDGKCILYSNIEKFNENWAINDFHFVEDILKQN